MAILHNRTQERGKTFFWQNLLTTVTELQKRRKRMSFWIISRTFLIIYLKIMLSLLNITNNVVALLIRHSLEAVPELRNTLDGPEWTNGWSFTSNSFARTWTSFFQKPFGRPHFGFHKLIMGWVGLGQVSKKPQLVHLCYSMKSFGTNPHLSVEVCE